MNTAISLQGEFSSFFTQSRTSRFALDLSKSNLIEVLEAYAGHKRRTSPNYANESIIANLKRIQDNHLQVLFPEDVTDEFYSCFIAWGIAKGLKLSSIKTYCTAIKSALSWGSRYGCKLSASFDELSIKAPEPHRVSLTIDEVSHIAFFDIDTLKCRSDHKKTLKRVRDAFVLQTNLFCRYSDLEKIGRDNFEGHVFSCVQQKTGGRAIVDIDRYSITPKLAFKILERYDYTCPYKGGIDNYNRYLHELLSYLGGSFDEDVVFEEKVGGKVIKRTYKRRDLIASHTSRRSAITLAVKNAKTETEVRRCSGHASAARDSFRRYIVYE